MRMNRHIGLLTAAAGILPMAGCGRAQTAHADSASGTAPAKHPQPEQDANVIQFVKNPDTAPAFQLNDLDGKSFSLAEAKGKIVLLNFWATWCGPCRAEIPDLIVLQEKYRDQLQIIGLTVDDDDASMIKEVVAETRINYPVAMSPPEVRMQYGGIAALPTSFWLAPHGVVV